MFRRNALLPSLALMCLATFLHGGCSVTLDPGDNGGTEGKVTIRIVNSTAADLDPQIYISSQVLSRDDFFKSANKYTNYGVFDQGLLGPYGQETFTIDCADAREVGTAGGRFNDGENTVGSDRNYILTQENVFFCDGVITFTYSRTNDGYTVRYVLD